MATLTVAKYMTTEEYPQLNGHHAGLLSTIVRPVASLFDQLSGPAMTDRDRQARNLVEAHNYLDPCLRS